jgi:hypothetical protein
MNFGKYDVILPGNRAFKPGRIERGACRRSSPDANLPSTNNNQINAHSLRPMRSKILVMFGHLWSSLVIFGHLWSRPPSISTIQFAFLPVPTPRSKALRTVLTL